MKEYMINSTIRTKVKLIISIISLALSVAISMLYNLLTKNIAEDNFWVVYMNVFLIPSMGAIASFLNFCFDRKLWKTKLFKKLLNTPNLSGLWQIEGTNVQGYTYTGELTIVQTFSRISIKGSFKESISNNEETYMSIDQEITTLRYYYVNEPKTGNTLLNIHHGFAVLRFVDQSNGSGKYFSDDFRGNQGNWVLKRIT